MLKIIKTEAEYDLALERLCELMQLDIELGTPEAEELDLIALLIEFMRKNIIKLCHPHLWEQLNSGWSKWGKTQVNFLKFWAHEAANQRY